MALNPMSFTAGLPEPAGLTLLVTRVDVATVYVRSRRRLGA